MKINKLAIYILLPVVVFLFSGCMQGSGKTKITFWHAMADNKDRVLSSLISEFEKQNPDIKVECQYVGNYDTLLQKLIASVGAGNPPDMSQVYENWTTRFKEVNAIIPVDSFFKGENGFTPEEIKDIFPIFVKNNSYGDTMWTYPFNKSIYVYYYNTSLFRKANLKPPWNLDEFLNVCKRLTKKDLSTGKIIQYGFGFRVNIDVFTILFYMNQGKFFNETETRATFNSAAGYETMQFIVDLVNKHKVAYYTKEYLDNDFASGRMASFFATTPHRSYLQPLLSFPLGIAPLPRWKTQTAPIAGTNLAIFSKKDSRAEERQKACFKLIKFFSSTENTVKWSIGTSYLPLRKSSLKDAVMTEHFKKEPLDKIGVEQLNNASLDPRIIIWQRVRTAIGDALEKALLNRSTSKDALDEAAKQTNELLEKEK